MEKRIITIDGPAGAGKTTVARQLASELGCLYVDTGALYRGVAYEISQQEIQWNDDAVLEQFLTTLDLSFRMAENCLTLLSHGKDISSFIRTSEISMLASATSARPQVRKALLGIQKEIARHHDAVFEGRDMGTVVFPRAPFKFFLFADLDVRARRRYDEMDAPDKNISKVSEQMAERDKNDSNRASAPLKPADDAIMINSSNMTIAQVVQKMISEVKKD